MAAALGASPAHGQYQPSDYQPTEGEPFFLLSDKAFGTKETAEVRLEVAARGYGLGQVESYGGVDVVVYRVPQPLGFLKQQKNLHRIRVEGLAKEEGLANTLSHLWDSWYKASRLAWRRIFSKDARQAVTREAPELKTSSAIHAATAFRYPPAFKPLPGYDLVDRFRYPVHQAAPIEPPKEVHLAGSSSEFIAPTAGNVKIPLRRLPAGLYLVEAYVGSHRANTMVFVADTVALTKTSAGEMLVWTAERTSGTAVANVELAWTDGTGVLASGRTDASGLARLVHEAPERSYVFGADPTGGLFISENFYYDSEIYDTKLYAVTDRPLYRPGDQVFVKFFGREFRSARKSIPIGAGEMALTVYDPGGAPVANQKLRIGPDTGADTSFRLPENATGGGYELRFSYGGGQYGAAFRVAEYQKPHFEITLVPDKADFKTKEEIGGRLQLSYPDGKPVKEAEIQLSVRAQQLTMVDGELGYYGQFPVKLSTETLRTDPRGEARFSLPAAEEPSRYVLTVSASDGAAFRVKTTRELLIERSQSAYALKTERHFSAPGEKVRFTIRPVGEGVAEALTWEWVRLEDRRRAGGAVAAADRLELAFAESGSYTVQLRDRRGNLVGGTSHWVSGEGMRAPVGSIEIVPSKEKCVPGEKVDLLITFPEPVDEALLTLERDRVERTALLRSSGGWVKATRIAPTQWRARVPVEAEFAPNVTFSVAYVKNGDYVFQNQGLQVARPRVDVAFRPEKAKYAPRETVRVEVATSVDGKPVAATVAVGVVDEMVYVLQPEIAPDLYDFFYHPRRNNVRTASSLSFISYDLAASRSRGAPAQRSMNERRVKVLERPRRDDVDTAFWQASLRTDSSGRASFSFVMPDSLTRWRLTGRAMTADGTVGQKTAHLRSDQDFYVKWTSPNWMRQGDAPTAAIAVFNQTGQEQKLELGVTAPGLSRSEPVTLKPGANFVAQPLAGLSGDGLIQVKLLRDGRTVDALETRFAKVPAAWRSPRTLKREVNGPLPLALPSDARNLRVTLVPSSTAQLSRVIDDLLEYPYGCVEQTASRMIPFALAIKALGPEAQPGADRLRQQLNSHRLRLAYLAGPKATFTWWGAGTAEDPFLTAYAYYADWRAVRVLGIELPSEHWSRLLDLYSREGYKLPVVQRALTLGWMQEMGLPVKGLTAGLWEALEKETPGAGVARIRHQGSLLIGEPEGRLAHAFAMALADRITRRDRGVPPPARARQIEQAGGVLGGSGLPLADALLIASDRLPMTEASRVLGAVRAEDPTMERALTLAWLDQALEGQAADTQAAPALPEPWQRTPTASGAVVWRWPSGEPLPAELRLSSSPGRAISAFVQFESAARETPQLPVSVERRFYRLKKNRPEGFALQPLAENAGFSTNELYLDEITLTPTGSPLHYALLEAPLPPGATVESTTWGINLDHGSSAEPLERARHEPTAQGYVVPVDPIAQPIRLRHLVRFAQKGTYVLPPARLYRMYQPEEKAFEGGGERRRMEVR